MLPHSACTVRARAAAPCSPQCDGRACRRVSGVGCRVSGGKSVSNVSAWGKRRRKYKSSSSISNTTKNTTKNTTDIDAGIDADAWLTVKPLSSYSWLQHVFVVARVSRMLPPLRPALDRVGNHKSAQLAQPLPTSPQVSSVNRELTNEMLPPLEQNGPPCEMSEAHFRPCWNNGLP
ncbi:uncharacterized protein UV8b_05138 [Ustilaginoidea virens]|uniref:Uncharacterized protein n=1 Tax=Ustilaginoidea virens TaxID=1159556 RepID=A0A8E5MIC5_USTVR|nr:uncharacterized protein UV8b_05138 [Ustilaginoidea virens]QUC20897.1 hypothetical protein UV8b_05138 [Ustilaginoidea virens]